MKQGILTLINNNLKKCLIILILISALDVTSFIIVLGYSSAIGVSSFLALMIAIYTISNVSGAKFGRLFNMHNIRWHYLKKHDKESTYQTSCLKYIAVLFPISAIWSIVNVIVAIVTKII
jgi:hypothetical protein